MRRLSVLLLAFACVCALALVSLSLLQSDRPAAAAPGISITLDPPIGGLSGPVGLTNAGDARLFVVEQGGTIRIISGGAVLPTPFLDVHTLISLSSERGLLGLAFHPNYAGNGYFYIYYTDTAGDLQLSRYSRSAGDPNLADPASGVPLLTIPHPVNANHNGGQLVFGPDGYLYLGPGDGGGGGDVPNNAQNRNVLLGKILRIDVDTPPGTPYAVPTTNPFYGQAGTRWEIWDWGLRNPWRFSFDRQTGALYIGDVGQGSWEEVDFEPAGSPGGNNYGWRLWEGQHCYNPATNCTPTPGATPFYPMVTPVAEYSHTFGCAITGGYVYRGLQSPALAGTYFFGDYCSGRIWGLWHLGPNQWHMAQIADTAIAITSFGEDAAGELYVVGSGAIYHIRQSGGQLYFPAVMENSAGG